MAKKRLSMADEMEFPNKTRQFLDFVGVTPNVLLQEQEAEPSDQYLSLAQIHLPSQQPRRYFSPQAMDSLVASIREHGILQPLLVRPSLEGGYELLAGERRYRAAQTLKLEKVPVLIRDLADQDAIQVALLENLQREDLNPIEETEAILQLLSIRLECSPEEAVSLLNHVANLQKQGTEITNNVVRSQWELVEQIFSVIGRLSPDSFRSHRLPLLNLPEDVLHVLRQGQLEYTKARTIAQVKDVQERQQLLAETLEHNLSVREIKKHIHEIQPTKTTGVPSALPNRMKDVYRRVRQAKIWEDPKKAKTLEKLLGQLESLVE
ncbi:MULTISPECIES: ParB/RepB/Spo0J family partition protein [Trichocoleus]|uniref:ParB/RepB/Spo0J family partition protein n=1 Tax=Trichocoleus desertorum GB2-A4 TaxID=2933944 RepID=A0ABV0JFZ0_9CYAN|nr:ParB/RepB/Spo0J family partition protein [Trichocoleus sp. FACHB-46]MBD1865044.1 ParB/RepB/Spo0J family partition protein [Trichocoleus sp. FACHB-46]